jgi:hypothetical protein
MSRRGEGSQSKVPTQSNGNQGRLPVVPSKHPYQRSQPWPSNGESLECGSVRVECVVCSTARGVLEGCCWKTRRGSRNSGQRQSLGRKGGPVARGPCRALFRFVIVPVQPEMDVGGEAATIRIVWRDIASSDDMPMSDEDATHGKGVKLGGSLASVQARRKQQHLDRPTEVECQPACCAVTTKESTQDETVWIRLMCVCARGQGRSSSIEDSLYE